MKSLGKSLLFLLAVLIALPMLIQSETFATETRVGSMGGVGLYTRDNSNIFYFPGAIVGYSGQLVAELRTKNVNNSYTVGGHFDMGSSVIGLYLNRPIQLDLVDLFVYVDPADIHVSLDRATDLFLGVPMQNFDLGFKLSVGFDSFADENDPAESDDDVDQSASYMSLGIGASNEKMDLGLLFELPRAKLEEGRAEDKIGGIGIGLTGRAFTGEGEMKLVPLGIFHYGSLNRKYDDGIEGTDDDEMTYKSLNVGLGLGINYSLNESSLLVIGIEALGISQEKVDEKDYSEMTSTTTTMPGFYMGAESQINSWLTGRLGTAQVYQKTTDKVEYDDSDDGTDSEVSIRSSQFKVTFGLAISLSSFTLDLSINEGLFFDGPNFVSGAENNFADRISLTYNF